MNEREVIEQCAKVCEDRANTYRATAAPGWQQVAHECMQNAEAIRALYTFDKWNDSRSCSPFPAAATMVIVRPEEYAQFEAFRRGEREAARAVKDAMQECEYWRFKYEKAAKGARYKFAWDTTQFQPCSHPDISYCDDSCVKAIHDSIEKGWCAQKC